MNNMYFPTITETESRLPYYLQGVGCHYMQEHVVRPDGYPYFQWIQCTQGEGELLAGNNVYHIHESQGMLLYPDEPHEYYAVTTTWQVDWIIFGGHQLKEFFEGAGMYKTQVFSISQPEYLLTKIRSALSIAKSGASTCGLDCSILVYELLINLMKYTSAEENDSILQRYSKLEPVFDYINNSYTEKMSLSDLSDIISISPQHLCVLFRKTLNSRVFEYINNVRIQKSKELLLTHRNKHIKQIAKLAGFDDFNYFCSVFRKVEKLSPGEFRRLYGA